MSRRPSRRTGSGWEALRMSGGDREFLTEVWEGSVSPCKGPPGGPGGISRPSQRSSWRSGRYEQALPEVRNGLGGPSKGPEGVVRPSKQSGRGQEALSEVLEGSGVPRGGPEWVGRPSWRFGRGREALAEVREAFSVDQQRLHRPSQPPGVAGRSSQRASRDRVALPDLRWGVGRLSRWAGKGWKALP